MLCICGCGEVKDAQNKLEGMLDTLKKGDYVSALEDYVCDKEENRDFLGCGDDFSKEGYPAYDAQKALFESIEYEVLGGKTTDGGNIIFDVKESKAHKFVQDIWEKMKHENIN